MQHATPGDLIFQRHSIEHLHRRLKLPTLAIHIDQCIANDHLAIQSEPENKAMHCPTNHLITSTTRGRQGTNNSKAIRAVASGNNTSKQGYSFALVV
jgi:hypothetical protein